MLAERTLREQILLLVALVVITGMGYLLLRYRPLQAQIAAARAQWSETETALNSVKWPPDVAGEAPGLEKQLAEMDQKIQAERLAVERLESRSAPTDEDLRQLNVEIAELAKNCGVDLRERKPYDPGGGKLPNIASLSPTKLPKDYLDRIGKTESKNQSLEIVSLRGPFVDVKSVEAASRWPLERITAQGTFTAMHRFISKLQTVGDQQQGPGRRVIIVQIEMDTEKSKDSSDPLLKATMIVGM